MVDSTERSYRMVSEMTNQEIMDKVVNHLLTQNERAQTGSGCRYRAIRSGKLLMCAVGCLIPDELYEEELEGRTVLTGPVIKALGYRLTDKDLTNDRINLLVLSQQVHDLELPSDWRRSLSELCGTLGLEFNPPPEAPHVEG